MSQELNLVGLKSIQKHGGELGGGDQSKSHRVDIISQNTLFQLNILYLFFFLSLLHTHTCTHTLLWVTM